jgi:hypothetical protein
VLDRRDVQAEQQAQRDPRAVPAMPIVAPAMKKTRSMDDGLAPTVRSTAMSRVLSSPA